MLENIISQKLPCSAAGELRWVFRRGLVENDICSCGHPFSHCDHWGGLEDLFSQADIERADSLRQKFDKFWMIIPLVLPGLQIASWKKLFLEYQDYLVRIYEYTTIASPVIVDNSKSPFYLLVLKTALHGKFEIFTVIFEREALSICQSYSKKKIRTESQSRELMRRRSNMQTLLYLFAIRSMSKVVQALDSRAARLTYSEVCKDQREVYRALEKITEWGSAEGSQFLNHSISGNPSRLLGFSQIKYEKAEAGTANFVVRVLASLLDRIFGVKS